MKHSTIIGLVFSCFYSAAQDSDSIKAIHSELDMLYIAEVQDDRSPDKVLHAEPLYIDLIRDLGARKGEREWNFGIGLTDNLKYDTYHALLEYEFAPVDRLGFEIELPVTLYAGQLNADRDSTPGHRIESIKVAVQWSFFVSSRTQTSMALGYINEFEFSDIKDFGRPLLRGNVYNPFFVAAKRFGNNWHTLIYTGPKFARESDTRHWDTKYELNTNLHYMISGTRNFVGIEFNKSFSKDFDMVIRPQMRVGVADNFLIGIVGGIPVSRENQRFSMFTRIIWEPRHE